jgi:hypothetical protein
MARLVRRILDRLRGPRPEPTKAFEIPASDAPRLAAEHQGELAQLFFGQRGRTVHKKVHYLDLYERHFARFRGRTVRMLEIGVSEGGSLDLWRGYFGAEATIFGIDVDPACAAKVEPPNQVRIGSQADPAFLRSVVAEMGAPDIVLDDGSHIGRDQRASFETLFPLLRDGGLYVIEDLSTSYWPGHEGGWRRRGTGIELVKELIDDMNGWYHDRPHRPEVRDRAAALHVYHSIVFVEKAPVAPPGHIRIG